LPSRRGKAAQWRTDRLPPHTRLRGRLFTESFQSARSEVSFSLADQDGNFTLFESAIPVAIDPVEVSIAFFNWNLQLRTSPVEGWLKHSVTQRNVEAISVPKPLWEVPLMALGVVCAVALGAAMLAMLVQKHLHQTLLQVCELRFGGRYTASRLESRVQTVHTVPPPHPVLCLVRIGRSVHRGLSLEPVQVHTCSSLQVRAR
jgi:hypothetical protein